MPNESPLEICSQTACPSFEETEGENETSPRTSVVRPASDVSMMECIAKNLIDES